MFNKKIYIQLTKYSVQQKEKKIGNRIQFFKEKKNRNSLKKIICKITPDWKNYSNVPRDWRLSASWDTIEGPLQTHGTSQQYGIEGHMRSLKLGPHHAEFFFSQSVDN